MKYYIKYLDCKNNFVESKKEFETFEEAWRWMVDTFDTPDRDLIHIY